MDQSSPVGPLSRDRLSRKEAKVRLGAFNIQAEVKARRFETGIRDEATHSVSKQTAANPAQPSFDDEISF